MRTAFVTLALVSALCSAHADPQEEALKVVQAWTTAFAESDVEGILRLHAPDALFFGTGSKTLVTKTEGLRAYFEQALLTNRPRGASMGEHSIRVISESAVVITGLDTVTGTKEGKTYSANGRVTFVIEKRGERWQIVHFHRSALPS